MGKASRRKRDRRAEPSVTGRAVLGFAGLQAAGMSPAAAFDQIAADTRDPLVQAIFENLRSTAAGRALLDASRAEWATIGLPAPWDAILELEKPNKTEQGQS